VSAFSPWQAARPRESVATGTKRRTSGAAAPPRRLDAGDLDARSIAVPSVSCVRDCRRPALAFASMPKESPRPQRRRDLERCEHQGRTLQETTALGKLARRSSHSMRGVRSGSYGDRPADCECPRSRRKRSVTVRRVVTSSQGRTGTDQSTSVVDPTAEECLLCQILRGRPIVVQARANRKDRQPGCRVSRLESAGMRIGQTRGEPQRLAVRSGAWPGLRLGRMASHRTVHRSSMPNARGLLGESRKVSGRAPNTTCMVLAPGCTVTYRGGGSARAETGTCWPVSASQLLRSRSTWVRGRRMRAC